LRGKTGCGELKYQDHAGCMGAAKTAVTVMSGEMSQRNIEESSRETFGIVR
jgi:hypothetical protein